MKHAKASITALIALLLLLAAVPPLLLTADATVGTFEQLLDAVDDASGPTTIFVDGDIDFADTVTIPDGKVITIRSTDGGTSILKAAYGARHFAIGSEAELTLESITLDGDYIGGDVEFQGGILNYGALTLKGGAVIQKCYALDYGGAVFNVLGTVYIDGAELTNNSAEHYGGGLYNNAGTVVMDSGSISSNTASDGGGAVNFSFGSPGVATITINGGEICGNTATRDGGGIMNYGVNTVTVNGGKIDGNTAIRDGGGINNYDTLYVLGGEVNGNLASSGGGVFNASEAEVSGGEVNGNSAGSGGGLYNVGEDSTLTVDGVLVDGNTAEYSGGGIYNSAYSALIVKNGCEITNNKATANFGGGIFNLRGTVDVDSCKISGNEARISGGGVFNGTGIVNVSGSEISANKANDGGGLYNSSNNPAIPCIATISGSDVTGNTAANAGGGAYNGSNCAMDFADCLVYGNKAATGGGIWTYDLAPLKVKVAEFDENTAAQAYWIVNAGDLAIYGVNITGVTRLSSAPAGSKPFVYAYNNFDIGYRDLADRDPVTKHTVRFEDWDGELIEAQSVEHGEAAVAPADPTRDGYTFIGWDTDFSNVTSDLTVTAEYSEDPLPGYGKLKMRKTVGKQLLATWSADAGVSIVDLIAGITFKAYKVAGDGAAFSGTPYSIGTVGIDGMVAFAPEGFAPGWYAIVEEFAPGSLAELAFADPAVLYVEFDGEKVISHNLEGFDYDSDYWSTDTFFNRSAKPNLTVTYRINGGAQMINPWFDDFFVREYFGPGSYGDAYPSFCSYYASSSMGGDANQKYVNKTDAFVILNPGVKETLLTAFNYIYDEWGSLDQWPKANIDNPAGSTKFIAQIAAWLLLDMGVTEAKSSTPGYAYVNKYVDEVVAFVAANPGDMGSGAVSDIVYLDHANYPPRLNNCQPQIVPIYEGVSFVNEELASTLTPLPSPNPSPTPTQTPTPSPTPTPTPTPSPTPAPSQGFTVYFPGAQDVKLEYYTNVVGWKTVPGGLFDYSVTFAIPLADQATFGTTTIRASMGGMNYTQTFTLDEMRSQPMHYVNVPVKTIRVSGIAAACDLGIVQSDWVYRRAPAAVGGTHYYNVFDNGRPYEVRIFKDGFYTISITGVDVGAPSATGYADIDLTDYFYSIDVPAGVTNLRMQSNNWIHNKTGAADPQIALLRDVGNEKTGKMSFIYGGNAYTDIAFTLDGTNPFDFL